MQIIDALFSKIGYIRKSYVTDQLNFARSVVKRLDEHREIVEAIQDKTTLFDEIWHINHMATQDDYLMRLFYMVHGFWPEESRRHAQTRPIRARPEILGPCRLPEYTLSLE